MCFEPSASVIVIRVVRIDPVILIESMFAFTGVVDVTAATACSRPMIKCPCTLHPLHEAISRYVIIASMCCLAVI